MARPVREGLNYFPFDLDFFEDPKILFIEEEHGIKGGYIAIRFLCWIYRDGYRTNWNEGVAVAMAKKIGNGVTSQEVTAVVDSLLKHGFLDKGMFEEHGILTSHGIQVRWADITKRSNRRGSIDPKYSIIKSDETPVKSDRTGVKSHKTPVKSHRTPGFAKGTTQSKVKKSKVGSKTPALPVGGSGQPRTPTLEEVRASFYGNGGTQEMADKFYSKYDALGWRLQNSPIWNYASLIPSYIKEWVKIEERNGGHAIAGNETENKKNANSYI